jgi:hypothetical protein
MVSEHDQQLVEALRKVKLVPLEALEGRLADHREDGLIRQV